MEYEQERVDSTANKVIEAVSVTYNSLSSQGDRQEAYEYIEMVKENVPLAVACGFHLCSRNIDPEVRSLGFQFIENAIKYHWFDISPMDKVNIKANVIRVYSNNAQNTFEEPTYIKDKMSRIIVEMMKREWPQQWVSLMDELKSLAESSPGLAEVVLMVLLRVSEDVAVLQCMEPLHRRREMARGLGMMADSLIKFCLSTLYLHGAPPAKTAGDRFTAHHRVAQMMFSTLASVCYWVQSQDLDKNVSEIHEALCKYIGNRHVRLHAAEFLIQVLSRKGSSDRKVLPVFFSQDLVKAVGEGFVAAAAEPFDENTNYAYLKSIAHVTASLGQVLCDILSAKCEGKVSECMSIYFELLLGIAEHPSVSVYSIASAQWSALFKRESLLRNSVFAPFVPRWINLSYSKLQRHGYLYMDDESSKYSRADFLDEAELHRTFSQCRSDSSEAFKSYAKADPGFMTSFVVDRLNACLDLVHPDNVKVARLSWEALAVIVDKVMTSVKMSKADFTVPHEVIRGLLLRCLSYPNRDPTTLSYVISCVSGLCVFLSHFPDVLPVLADTLFQLSLYKDDNNQDVLSREVKDLRVHAVGCLLNLVQDNTKLFLQIFQQLDAKICEAIQGREYTRMTKVILFEILLINNRSVESFDSQKDYIAKLCSHFGQHWETLRGVFSSSQSLLECTGLNAPALPHDPTQETFREIRYYSVLCLEYLSAILRRSPIQFDKDVATRSGFALKDDETGVFFKNPCAPQIFNFLPLVFGALRAFNGLFVDQCLRCFHHDYTKVFAISEEERRTLLSLPSPPMLSRTKEKTLLDHQHLFYRQLNNHLTYIISTCPNSLSVEFYQYPHLAESLIHSAFYNLQKVPNILWRPIIRILRPLVENCPSECYQTVLVPILAHACPIFLSELEARWTSNLAKFGPNSDDNNEEEITESVLLHIVTKDYLEFIAALLAEKDKNAKKSTPSEGNSNVENNGAMDTSDELMMTSGPKGAFGEITCQDVSAVAKVMLKNDAIAYSLVVTLMRCINWPETVTCRKAAPLLLMCLQELVRERPDFMKDEAVIEVYVSVLKCLNVHGQHDEDDGLLSFAISAYELLRPRVPGVKELILTLPGSSDHKVYEFESSCAKIAGFAGERGERSASKREAKEKKARKMAFYKIVEQVIGRNICEAFKRHVKYAKLAPFSKPRKTENSDLLDSAGQPVNLCLLFGGPQESNGRS